MQEFWSNFVANAGGGAVGALVAFIFGLRLAQFEFANERRQRQLDRREIDILSLKAAIDSSSQNLAELLSLKGQIVLPLLKDVEGLQQVMDANKDDQGPWIAKLATLPDWGKEYQTPSFAATPSSDRFGFAIDDAPQITSYLHRAATTLQKVTSSIELRNELVRRFADTARGGPLKMGDADYLFTMLNSYARSFGSNVDDAIFFNHVLHDQCYYLGVEKFTRPSFRRIIFVPEKASLVPPDDYVPGIRKHLATFGRPKISLFE